MSLSQIVELLKSTSASKVKSIELLYSSPPKYGVKGGSINIIMEKKVNEDLSADISLTGKASFLLLANRISEFILLQKEI